MDYQMRMVPRGGAGISNLEYSTWRSTGNAYNFGDSEEEMEETYCQPNNSLGSSLVTHKGGDRLSRRGYWGDIITGPFLVYGLEQKDEVDMSTTKTSRTSQTLAKSRMETIVMRLHEKMSAPPEYRVTIRFLPTNADRDLLEPYDEEDETLFVEKHKRKFQRVFVGCSITHLLTAGLRECLNQIECNLYLETP